jgi:hypothetical protein
MGVEVVATATVVIAPEAFHAGIHVKQLRAERVEKR